jgi:hypothetical protein
MCSHLLAILFFHQDLMKKGPFNGAEVEASGCNGHKVEKHPVLETKSKSIP